MHSPKKFIPAAPTPTWPPWPILAVILIREMKLKFKVRIYGVVVVPNIGADNSESSAVEL